ncbi:2-hydroxychromene-2-carboxylate isomerase [Mesobaculum littorinae]|uniref:2-hydroxychromene-2-carboxylate isomerase n=1 Tax=Mesobaculum littorinae TaxID=2486419 RepID=A0A438AKA3_9RHOB|nr:2-hydroxychromene-2-carboxylate isomerase [Mesobaculum littorinae]RVV99122.1 2-hydroxychromene-2-carboxylate isomerase [Mesobaculum littorinae]
MPKIDYFFSTLSPYAYLAGDGLERIAARHDATIVYKPLDLAQLFPRTGGTPVGDRHPARLEYRAQDLARSARKVGLPLAVAPAHWPTNAAPSSYAVIAAQRAVEAGADGDVGALVRAILAACWAEERDIAEDDTIRDCLARTGFDPALADSGLLAGAETYAANLEEAAARGVFGAPFYITPDDARFWGRDRLEDLDLHLGGKI